METKDLDKTVELLATFNFEKILLFFVGLLIIIFVVRKINHFTSKLNNWMPSRRLFFLQITTVISFIVYIIGTGALFYGVLNPSKELLVTIGGSLAVAVGLSIKDVVGSFIAGLILLFDRPFQVGDRVTFDGQYGDIKSIGLRAVRLNTLDDNLVTIPNSQFITELVASGNAGALDMMVVSEFYIGLDANINVAKDIIKEVVVTSRYVYLAKPVVIVVQEVVLENILAVKLSAKAYVLDVKYEKAFLSDITTRVSKEFFTRNVKRPVLMTASQTL